MESIIAIILREWKALGVSVRSRNGQLGNEYLIRTFRVRDDFQLKLRVVPVA